MADGAGRSLRRRLRSTTLIPWLVAALVALAVLAASDLAKAWWGALPRGSRAVLAAALAAAAAWLAVWAVLRAVRAGWDVRVDSAKVKLPVLGEIVLRIESDQREAGWRILLELATRIATRRLEARDGILREALASLHTLFGTVRDALAAAPPSEGGAGEEQADIHAFAIAVLNDALRPCLARWHPRLAAWEASGRSESEWPLAGACRADLEATRRRTLAFAFALGDALRVPRLADLLGDERPDPEGLAPLMDADELAALEARLPPSLPAAAAGAAWRIYVALRTRVATAPLPDDAGLLGEALDSLYTLFGDLRAALDALGRPSPPPPEGAEPLEAIVLRVMNGHLRPFLAAWHPRLAEWRRAHPDAPEAEWPEAEACRAALARMREGVEREVEALERLMGMGSGADAPDR